MGCDDGYRVRDEVRGTQWLGQEYRMEGIALHRLLRIFRALV